MTTENILPLGWQSINLGEFVLPQSGTRPYGGVTVDSGNIPSLGGENIKLSGGVIYEPVKKISEKFFSQMKKGILKDEDVLINKDGANTGKVGFYSSAPYSKASVNEHVFILRANPQKLTQKYLYYLLASEVGQKKVKDKISGSAQPGLNSGFLKGQSFAIPALINEQQAITSILSTIDEAIAQSESLLQKYQSIKQGLMFDLLTRGVDENGELRPSFEEAPELYKETELGLLPINWDVLKIRDARKSITSGSRWWAKYYSDEGALFLRIGNLTRDHINLRFDSTQRVRVPNDAESKRTAVETGDVLISVTADLGIIGVIPENFEEAYINQHIALVKVNPEITNSRWLGHFMASRFGWQQFQILNDSGAKAGLNLPTVESLFFANPSKEERDYIVKLVDNQDNMIQIEKKQVAKLNLLKQGLMQDLLSGQVRVKV